MSGNICAATNSPSPCSKATTISSTNPAPHGTSSPTIPNASPQSHPELGRRSILEAVGIRRAESVIKPNLPKPKDRLFEREEIRQRVADFKATQLKFEREREEYFKRTLAKVRSGSLTIPKRLPALKVENRNQQGR